MIKFFHHNLIEIIYREINKTFHFEEELIIFNGFIINLIIVKLLPWILEDYIRIKKTNYG